MKARFVEQSLLKFKEELKGLPELYQVRKRQLEKEIDRLCEEAGILTKIEAHKKEIEQVKAAIQSKADILSGRIKMLEELHHEFFLAPIPEGVTHMHGLELSKLEPKTRLLVMGGNADTIKNLGGTLEVEKEVLEPAPKPRKKKPLYEWDTSLHWKTRIKRALMILQQDEKYFDFIYNAETESVQRKLDELLAEIEEEFSEEAYSEDGEDNTY